MRLGLLCAAAAALWPAAANAASAAPPIVSAAEAPQPRPRPAARADDDISRMINAAGAEPQPKPAAPETAVPAAPPLQPAESLPSLRPQPFISPLKAPVPQPAPARADNDSPDNSPAADDSGEEPAPVFTAPVPIPVPMPMPEAEPAPLPLPDSNGPVTAPAERYEAAPNAPLTYPQAARGGSFAFPRFGDRKPHAWTGRRKPWHYAIHGTDVSRHNGSIDWSAMVRGHISFVFIKATEGGDHLDPAFRQNWQAAKMVGLARGAYHFYYFCRPVKDQLKWYIQNVPRDRNAMPPVLDIEWNHTSPTCRRHPAPAEVQKNMDYFLRGVERYYGKKPIIYTTVDFFRDNNLNVFRKKYPFWLRSVAAHPDDRYNGHPWLFWQYTGTGRVPGIAGDADISVFVGNQKQWRSWLGTIRRQAGQRPCFLLPCFVFPTKPPLGRSRPGTIRRQAGQRPCFLPPCFVFPTKPPLERSWLGTIRRQAGQRHCFLPPCFVFPAKPPLGRSRPGIIRRQAGQRPCFLPPCFVFPTKPPLGRSRPGTIRRQAGQS